MPCPLKKLLLPGLKVQVYNVVTCYDPIHLLQGRCQHLAGVRHHRSVNLREKRGVRHNKDPQRTLPENIKEKQHQLCAKPQLKLNASFENQVHLPEKDL